MTSVRVVMVEQDEWIAQVRDGVRDLFEEKLGPEILKDAQHYVPVDTTRLQRSLAFQVVDGEDGLPELQVGAFPDDKGPIAYAAATEVGFEGPEHVREYAVIRGFDSADNASGHVVRAHMREGYTPAQPYLQPALFTER